MTSSESAQADRHLLALAEPPAPEGGALRDEFGGIEISPELRAELLDPNGWREVLETYAHTMKLGVALTDSEGHILGAGHNPQPIWTLIRGATTQQNSGCPFCLAPPLSCTAVADALQTGRTMMVRDQAGLAHVAVPLTLGNQRLGALIAGQVFDRYPEPLPLQRVAKEFGASAPQLWQLAIKQAPISRSTLHVYGDLLRALGQAFLRQRLGAIVERKLAETNRRFRLLVEGVKDYALFTLDAYGLVTSWNSGAERLLGYAEAEIVGRDFSCMFTPEDVQKGAPRQELEEALREGRAENERWQVRKDGSRFFASSVVASVGEGEHRELGKIMRDSTERRNAEQALMQAQKLESIGILAGGIAHDFNNLLAGILGNASLLLENSSPGDPNRPQLEDIVTCSKRAAALTTQLLAYAGKGLFVISRFNLSEVIPEMLHLIQISIPKKVELELSMAADLPLIEGDASQIQQIVMNLVLNAAEAIGHEGGVVRVSTGVSVGDGIDENNPGTYVYLEVRDSGCGMDEATRGRIFDPFFTTKFAGRGLGLAAVSGIIRSHKGRMQVDSVPGKGSTFKLFLPALQSSAAGNEDRPSPAYLRGTGTILIADDEDVVRRLAQAMLEHCGYSVLLAGNGLEAVDLFRRKAHEIRAVLLDITMPIMGGDDAFKEMRAIRPDVPVVFSSGYSELEAREQFAGAGLTGFIQKPYTLARLAEKFRALLETAPT